MDKNKKLFPQRLWDLVHDDRYNHFIRWSDDGQRVYLNRNEFEQCYLRTPNNQFHTQKAISFVRQMNMYGFKKVDDSHYENDNFKRGCHHLIKHMVRRNSNRPPAHAASASTAAAASVARSTSAAADATTAAMAMAAAAATAASSPISPSTFPLSLALSDGQSLAMMNQRDVSVHTTHNNSGRSSTSTMSSGACNSTATAVAAAAAAAAAAVGTIPANTMPGVPHEALVVPACRSTGPPNNFGTDQQYANTASLLGALDMRGQGSNLGSLYEQLIYWYQLLAFRRATE